MSEPVKIAIVTGASSGIGRTTAVALLVAGWNVALTGRREDALKETADMAGRSSGTLVVVGDVTDEAFVKDLFARTVAYFGESPWAQCLSSFIFVFKTRPARSSFQREYDLVSFLWNTSRFLQNAGIPSPQVPIDELPLSTFQQVTNVNLIGPFLCTREAVKVFKAQSPPGGRIINNGSLSSHVPRPHSSPYTCSKHALLGLTKCTSLDGRAHDITCTQIDIGNAHTEMAAGHTNGALQPDGRMVPEPTMNVKHVADSIVHIASLPNNVTVLEYKIMPSGVPFVGRG